MAAAARWIQRFALLLSACTRSDAPTAEGIDAAADAPPWTPRAPDPDPRPGMVWIAPGVLIAGTPPDRLPRVADEELAGEQVVMRAFMIDVFPYPNEAGAIPTTNLSHPEAEAACAEQGKRLCTELELERACKGPSNTTYEYGDRYNAAVCRTGSDRALVPNGVNTGCKSAFGVHDLHGGVWSWTASAWGRSGKPGLMTIRGGNGRAGELIGRCANARALAPGAHQVNVGFRCCAGEVNHFEVLLEVSRGEPLKWRPPDKEVAPALERLVREQKLLGFEPRLERDAFHVERMWTWHPLGNEELLVGGGCARTPAHAHCGVVIARPRSLDAPLTLSFVASDRWQPTLGETGSPRELFLHGGDPNGAFRIKISYDWGRITLGPKERKKRRGAGRYTYD